MFKAVYKEIQGVVRGYFVQRKADKFIKSRLEYLQNKEMIK